MLRSISALFLGLFASLAFAQTATPATPPKATLAWSAVSKDIAGANLVGAVTYNLYQAVQGAPLTKVQTALVGVTGVISTGLTAGSTQCFSVTAVNSGLESDLAAPVCAAVPFVSPGIPSQITVVIR